MRDIELAAEAVGTKLIKGEQVFLGKQEQAALASFIAQSALMINLLSRLEHKFPQSAYDYFYANKTPPPHWYVGIGYFNDFPRVSVDISPFVAIAGGKVTANSISTTLGCLFTAVQFLDPAGSNDVNTWPVRVNEPQLTPIWPHLNYIVGFPPPLFLALTGGFWPDGGSAREISRRFPLAVSDFIKKALGTPQSSETRGA